MAFEICIVGLGLMGASMAQALKDFKSARITGVDTNPDVLEKALKEEMVHAATAEITSGAASADLIVFCVYARHIPALLQSCAGHLKPGVVLTDICGVKQDLYDKILPNLPGNAIYVGIHPMAGRERDGIENATASLYQNSSMLICPTEVSSPASIALMDALARHIGCVRVRHVSCSQHDAIIAYTSDLMHIASAGLCIHFHPDMDQSFTAGAFRDCTRIADINATAWTGLLLENRQNVLTCLGVYIEDLGRIKAAIEGGDATALAELLESAGRNKREMLTR